MSTILILIKKIGLLIFASSIFASPLVIADEAITEQIRQYIEKYRSTGNLSVDGIDLSSTYVLPAFYERRTYRPAWTQTTKFDDLIQMVGRAEEEGLLPEDYHYSHLEELRSRDTSDANSLATLDILLTDSLVRYGYHQKFGKVNPVKLDSNWNLTRTIGGNDPAEVIQGAIDSKDIREYISEILQRGPYYRRMKDLLAEYRAKATDVKNIQAVIPEGPALKRGMEDARVGLLRTRLQEYGDLDKAPIDNPNLFDEELENAVKVFQQSAALDVDGIVGAGTLAQLNTSVQSRIDQIRVNMERIRWIFRDIRDNEDFVIVNIAGFETMLVRNHEVVWRTRAQVGRTYRKTPVFRAEMKYAQFNPTWTVPPTILRRDIFPKVKADPSYLASNNMKLIDNKSGNEINPDSIDWENLEVRGFPYQVVQQPGINNALGQVKFIFPNSHFVFLHDTPSKKLFDKNVRTFSSGCIRIEDPFTFAELLLDDPQWNQETIQKTLDSGQIKTVYLNTPIPVLVLYWTVEPTGKDGPKFLPDIYERDGAILKALNEPFEFTPPDGLQDWSQDAAE